MSLSDAHRTREVSTWMVSGEVGLKRTKFRNWAMYWLGMGVVFFASRMRVGEYVF